MIDPTITAGNIIEISVILTGGVAAILSMRATVYGLTRDMTDMKAEIKKVGEVLIKMAVHSTRLDNVEQDIRELKNRR